MPTAPYFHWPRDEDVLLTPYDVHYIGIHVATGELFASTDRVHGHHWSRGVTLRIHETGDSPQRYEVEIAKREDGEPDYLVLLREDGSYACGYLADNVTEIHELNAVEDAETE